MQRARENPITMAQARAAVRAGARLRAVLCVQEGEGFVPLLRFVGVPKWRQLMDQKAKPRSWTSLDRLLRSLSDIFGAVCVMVCPAGHPCLRRVGVLPA